MMSVCHELSVSSPCLRRRAPSHSTHVCELTVSTTACAKSQHTCLQQRVRTSSHNTHVYTMRQVTAHMSTTARANVKSQHTCLHHASSHRTHVYNSACERQVTAHMSTTARANVKSQHTCLQQRVRTSSHSTINPNKMIIFTTREGLCRREVIKCAELKARAHSLTRCGSKKASKSTRTRAAAVHRRAVVVDTKPKLF
jgi:hypothetical protein